MVLAERHVMNILRRKSALVALVIAASCFGPVARAQELRAAASAAFREGEAAERAGKFREAATHYREADSLVPNDTVLAAALEMAEKADAPTLALQLAERAKTRKLPRLQTIVARIQKNMVARSSRLKVECERPCTVELDGAPFGVGDEQWIEPGPHELTYRKGEMRTPEARALTIEPGKQLVLTMIEPPAPAPEPTPPAPAASIPPPPATPPVPTSSPPPPPPKRNVLPDTVESRPPLPPWVFFVATGVTAATGAVTLASAIDVKTKHDEFVDAGCLGALPPASCDGSATSGSSAQSRTNVLLGITAGAFVATAALGLFLVDWKGDPAPKRSRAASRWALVPQPRGATFHLEWP